MIYNLQGLTEGVGDLSHEDFEEEHYCANFLSKHHPNLQSRYYYSKILLYYLAGEYKKIVDLFPEMAEEIFFVESDFVFLFSLSYAALYPESSRSKQYEYRKRLGKFRKQLKKWAEVCPENFLHRSLLVEAEMARINGLERKAMDLYDQAIAAGSKNGYVNHAAMANECAAQFYIGMGKGNIATTYLAAAHYGYLQWGAYVQANQLETQHPALISASEGSASSSRIDFQSVMKAARTISGEIVLEKLLEETN